MSNRMPTLLLFFAILPGSFSGMVAGDAPKGDPLFYISFENGLKPDLAVGDGEPVVIGAPTFAEGKIGKGLVVGKPGNFITYQSVENLSVEEGTLALWANSMNWKIPDSQFHIFFESTPYLILYSHMEGSPIFFWASRQGCSGPTAVAGWGAKWAEGEWHHLAASWRDQKMTLYFDGVRRGGKTADFPLKASKFFSIGPQTGTWKYDGDPDSKPLSVIDEFRIYKRALTDAEVTALFDQTNK